MGLLSGLGKSLSKGWKSLTKTIGKTGNVFSGALSFFDSTQHDVEEAWDDYTGKNVAEKNLKEQRRQFDLQNSLNERQFEYQKQLNEQTQQREDTAMQRKVADLKAAGLNPVLAAGGSGSSSAALSAPALKAAPAPQFDDYSGGVRGAIGQIFDLISMKKNFAVQDKQISLMKAQEDDAVASADKKRAEADAIRIENKFLEDRFLNENVGIRLRNEGQAGRNIYQGYQNAIAENELYISSSTKFAQVEDRLLSVDQRRKNLLNIDADLILKADKHLWYQYENNLQDVRSIWAGKLAAKEFDIKTYEAVAKALTITQVEEDIKLYMKAKEELMKKYKDPQVVRRKLALQFGSYSSIYDQLQDVITGAGHKAGEFLRDIGIDFHF